MGGIWTHGNNTGPISQNAACEHQEAQKNEGKKQISLRDYLSSWCIDFNTRLIIAAILRRRGHLIVESPSSSGATNPIQIEYTSDGSNSATDFGPWALTKSTLRTVLVFKFALSAVWVRLYAENPTSQMELSGSIKHDILVKIIIFW